MTERFEIFPQNVAKDGTLIIIQKGLKLYNISDVVDLLNALHEENQQLSKDKQLAEVELMTYKQRVKDELEMRYCLSNHKPVFEFMAKELDITLEGNVE